MPSIDPSADMIIYRPIHPNPHYCSLTHCGSPARPRSGRDRCNRSLSGPALPIRQISIHKSARLEYLNFLPTAYLKQVLIT